MCSSQTMRSGVRVVVSPWCSWPCWRPTGWPCSPPLLWPAGGRSFSPEPNRKRCWSEPRTPLYSNTGGTYLVHQNPPDFNIIYHKPSSEKSTAQIWDHQTINVFLLLVCTHAVAMRSWWCWQQPYWSHWGAGSFVWTAAEVNSWSSVRISEDRHQPLVQRRPAATQKPADSQRQRFHAVVLSLGKLFIRSFSVWKPSDSFISNSSSIRLHVFKALLFSVETPPEFIMIWFIQQHFNLIDLPHNNNWTLKENFNSKNKILQFEFRFMH